MMKDPASNQSWIYYAIVLALSVLYYGLYINSGFSPADDGNYAQIAYELYLGRSPDELSINYGILWFKIGEGLFEVFGVNYTLVKGVFFATITLTNLLIFYTIALACGSRLFALAMILIPALVPAFPATAFYGLCIMMNAAVQMNLACKIKSITWKSAALAGAVLSLSFQIRPDFGYIWAVPLGIILILACLNEGGMRKAQTLFGAAALGFASVQIPFFLTAMASGYAGLMLQQYLSYPMTMIDYAMSGLQGLFGSTTSQIDSPGSTSLQRPGIMAIFGGTAGMAALIYIPVIAIAGFLLVAATAWKDIWDKQHRERSAKMLVAFFAAASAFPHYFFYRPDLSHIANFMPGYTVLAAVMIATLYQKIQTADPSWVKILSFTATAAMALHLGLYAWIGLTTPGTGSIAGASARTQLFQAGNGVNVFVTAAEKNQYELVRTAIAENSTPEDRIVCVPYCPGFAFMAERQMLFGQFYVDDATPMLSPGWTERAISLTTAARPPVVIVMDWAINGTDESRFATWAADYVLTLEKLSREKIVRPGLTLYLL